MNTTTLVWNCTECGHSDISEDYFDCPTCGTENPSVVNISHTFRPYDGNTGDAGGATFTAGGFVVEFDSTVTHGAMFGHSCRRCGATVIDYPLHFTGPNGGAAKRSPVNHNAHTMFHARLGF